MQFQQSHSATGPIPLARVHPGHDARVDVDPRDCAGLLDRPVVIERGYGQPPGAFASERQRRKVVARPRLSGHQAAKLAEHAVSQERKRVAIVWVPTIHSRVPRRDEGRHLQRGSFSEQRDRGKHALDVEAPEWAGTVRAVWSSNAAQTKWRAEAKSGAPIARLLPVTVAASFSVISNDAGIPASTEAPAPSRTTSATPSCSQLVAASACSTGRNHARMLVIGALSVALRNSCSYSSVLHMVTPTTTFRLNDRERRQLERLADDLVCSRSDVLRHGMAALRDDPELRTQIKADNVARSFLKSLRTIYGDNAVLELVDGPDDENWRVAGEPLDPLVVDVMVKHQGDRWVLDLLDKATGVAIHNVMSWTDEDGYRHAVVPLRDLWVYSSRGAVGEPKARQLYDGRTVVRIEEDDGAPRHLVIDNGGNASPLAGDDVPAAAFTDAEPSVGIGIRRDSELGPHLGRGFGGKYVLSGDLASDREAVEGLLERLLERTRRGDLDDILAVPATRSSDATPRAARVGKG